MKKVVTLLISTISVSYLSSCGSSSCGSSFPDLATLAANVVPKVSSSTTYSLTGDYKIFAYNSVSNFNSAKTDFDDIFGSEEGVNTKIRNQLSLTDIGTFYLSSSGTPTNCTKTISSTDTGFKIPFFGESTTSATFFATTYPDSGKYTCYVYKSTSSGDTSLAFGVETISSPPSGCTDAKKYYVAYGYSSSGTNFGHQIQKFYYDGCTGDIAIAMALSSTRDTTITNGTSQGFNGRFELKGNTKDYSFAL